MVDASQTHTEHRTIPLTKGYHAIVDVDDYEWLNQWKWHINPRGYVARTLRKNESLVKATIRMHNFILNTPNGMSTDHINGDKLDNRRCNLRICTQSQNIANSKIWKRKKSSTYKGVCYFKRDGNWQSYIMVERKRIHIGYFPTEIEAAQAYNGAAKEYFGEFARLNEMKEFM